MTYIKRLVIKGFKSFPKETTLLMDTHTNVIVGPNGSGKSNITDAICFVLGRLSIKSMRAAKSAHLIFSGNKRYKPSNEAYVEIVFDNSEKTFSLDETEIIIKRIVKKNGLSTYKINNQVKTRQEVVETLGQAGIDPHGFNIVLQGEIERFVKMPSDERKKVIEEVAGISIYEMRKAKSLKELEKTDEKLRQVNAVLRERTNYLKNLENERDQALKFKKLEETVKRCRASILNKNMLAKQKELDEILKKSEGINSNIQKKQLEIDKIQEEISSLNIKIEEIANKIQKSSGLEQDSLMMEISKLKQEIAGLIARKENFENNIQELDRRKKALETDIKNSEREIEEMTKEKGKNKKKELEDKKKRLEELEESKRNYYLIKSNLSSVNNQIEDKKRQIQRLKEEGNIIILKIEGLEGEIKTKHKKGEVKEALDKLKEYLDNTKKKIVEKEKELLDKEKKYAVLGEKIKHAEKIKSQVSSMDICPLCKSKITVEHIKEVIDISNKEIEESNNKIKELNEEMSKIKEDIENSKKDISDKTNVIRETEIDIIKLQAIEDKKQELRRNAEQRELDEKELIKLEDKKKQLSDKFPDVKTSEAQYESLRLEVNELQRSEEKNLGMEISTKQRELERMRLSIKQNIRDRKETEENLKTMQESLEEKQLTVDKKEKQAEELKKKYQKMFDEKNSFQDKVRVFESSLMRTQNDKRIFEGDLNNLMIEKAQVSAQKESLVQELDSFKGVELLNLPIEALKEKLTNSEQIIGRIGNVNLRALEVYDNIKAEYDKIREKVDQLLKEKEELLKVIAQIDKKKRKVFLTTLSKINELFTRNFGELSEKGVVSLVPQNTKEIFEGGLDITVKIGAGKYFDVTSLSGGEQTLVALSLIFAIQEYKPYYFYIFDEIDAALDKRNSEKLAYLLKRYMKHNQYLIITHNDSIISESSNVLYGVTMQEGISKVVSLQI
jgi:chromosome segregation protein